MSTSSGVLMYNGVVFMGTSNTASNVSYDNTSSGLTATTIQAAIDQVEARVDTAESTISSHTTSIGTANTNISSLQTTVSGHTTSIGTANSNISSLQTTVGGHTTSINTLTSNLNSLTTTVNGKQSVLSIGTYDLSKVADASIPTAFGGFTYQAVVAGFDLNAALGKTVIACWVQAVGNDTAWSDNSSQDTVMLQSFNFNAKVWLNARINSKSYQTCRLRVGYIAQ